MSTLLLDAASLREHVSDMVDMKYAAVHSLQGQGICFHRPETRDRLIERGLHAIAQLRQQVYLAVLVTPSSYASHVVRYSHGR